ncbi:MAG: RsiV family protein [Minisyncoccales bacterium]
MENKKLTTIILILVVIVIFGGVLFLYLNLGDFSFADVSIESSNKSEEKELSYEVSLKEEELREDNYEIDVEEIKSNSLGADEVNKFIKKQISDFKEKSNNEVPPLRERGFDHKYTMNIDVESHQNENYVSYILNIGKYTGGANMNQIIESFIFNKDNNKEVTLSDIILENKKDEFMKQVRKALKEADTFPGIEDNFHFSDIHSFYLTEDKLNIVFSKYEVAPGAAGIIEISIDSDKLIR